MVLAYGEGVIVLKVGRSEGDGSEGAVELDDTVAFTSLYAFTDDGEGCAAEFRGGTTALDGEGLGCVEVKLGECAWRTEAPDGKDRIGDWGGEGDGLGDG